MASSLHAKISQDSLEEDVNNAQSKRLTLWLFLVGVIIFIRITVSIHILHFLQITSILAEER